MIVKQPTKKQIALATMDMMKSPTMEVRKNGRFTHLKITKEAQEEFGTNSSSSVANVRANT